MILEFLVAAVAVGFLLRAARIVRRNAPGIFLVLCTWTWSTCVYTLRHLKYVIQFFKLPDVWNSIFFKLKDASAGDIHFTINQTDNVDSSRSTKTQSEWESLMCCGWWLRCSSEHDERLCVSRFLNFFFCKVLSSLHHHYPVGYTYYSHRNPRNRPM